MQPSVTMPPAPSRDRLWFVTSIAERYVNQAHRPTKAAMNPALASAYESFNTDVWRFFGPATQASTDRAYYLIDRIMASLARVWSDAARALGPPDLANPRVRIARQGLVDAAPCVADLASVYPSDIAEGLWDSWQAHSRFLLASVANDDPHDLVEIKGVFAAGAGLARATISDLEHEVRRQAFMARRRQYRYQVYETVDVAQLPAGWEA